VIELRSEKSNVEGSRSTEKTLVLVWTGCSITEFAETLVSLEGSNGGIYGVLTFSDGLTSTELDASNGDGTGSGQGTNNVEATNAPCLPFITVWFNDWCVGDVLANKGFGTGMESLSATLVLVVTF
jgi:hypothetical protein